MVDSISPLKDSSRERGSALVAALLVMTLLVLVAAVGAPRGISAMKSAEAVRTRSEEKWEARARAETGLSFFTERLRSAFDADLKSGRERLQGIMLSAFDSDGIPPAASHPVVVAGPNGTSSYSGCESVTNGCTSILGNVDNYLTVRRSLINDAFFRDSQLPTGTVGIADIHVVERRAMTTGGETAYRVEYILDARGGQNGRARDRGEVMLGVNDISCNTSITASATEQTIIRGQSATLSVNYQRARTLVLSAGGGSLTVFPVNNYSFEQPVVGSGASAYQYSPAGATWTFATNGGGIAGNGSGFTAANPPAPDGGQVAFLQGVGSMRQTLSGFQGGVTYTISFLAAQRGNIQASSQDFRVLLDSTVIGTYRPAGTNYAQITTNGFTTTPGTHTLSFVGLDSLGGDNTAFIDNVQITASGASEIERRAVDDNLNPQTAAFSVTPSTDTTYTIQALGSGSCSATTTETIHVQAQVCPSITSFSPSPSSVTAGAQSTLAWATTNATTVRLNGVVVAASGSLVVTPSQTTTYVLEAIGDNGYCPQTSTQTVTVTPCPTVNLFDANPTTITRGDSAIVRWDVSNAPPAPPSQPRVNVAAAANGGIASASGNYPGYPPSATNNGDRAGLNPFGGGLWHDGGASNTFPDWLQVDFNGTKVVDEVDLFSVQDNYQSPSEPTPAMTFSLYGLTAFQVQYWNGATWQTVPGGSVTGNNLVWKKVSFPAVATSKIRVLISATVDGISRAIEIEAWGTPQPSSGVFLDGVPVAASGSQTVSPSATQTYNLRVVGPTACAQIDRYVTVTVNSRPCPQITSFTSNLSNVVEGNFISLSWAVANVNAATTIRLTGGGLDETVAASGTRQVWMNNRGSYTFTLTASSTYPECPTPDTRSVPVTVGAMTAPVVSCPTLDSFSASSSCVAAGSQVALSWNGAVSGTSSPYNGKPFSGAPISIPGTLEPELFDVGGEGVAYHDTTPGNFGQDYDQPPSYPTPSFRQPTDVDIFKFIGYSNGYLVMMHAGDWMKYTVNVTQGGSYALTASVAWGSTTGGTFHIEVDGIDKTGPIAIPNTNWSLQPISVSGIQLTPGQHVLSIVADTNAANGYMGDIDYVQFTATGDGTSFTGIPIAVPGTVEVENYNNGGSGVAYFDTTLGSHGQDYDNPPSYPPPSYRQPTDVDIYKASSYYSNGYLIVMQAGDWTKYAVNVTQTGVYTLRASVAWGGGYPGGTFRIEVDGENRTGSITIPDTGWGLQVISKSGIQLTAGLHTMRLVAETNGVSGYTGDIDYFSFTYTGALTQTDLALGKPATQSSTYVGAGGAVASVAVDGDTNGNWSQDYSVTATNNDYQAWWQVDLGGVYSIDHINLWNRTDSGADRLSNFYVLVSNSPFTSTDLQTTINQSGVSSYYVAGPVGVNMTQSVNRMGRYVRVQLAGTNYLSLAEVEVIGLVTPSSSSTSSSATVQINGAGNYPLSGTATFTVNAATNYTITVSSPSCPTLTRSVFVDVAQPAPVINSYSASTTTPRAGDPISLTWSTTGAVSGDINGAPLNNPASGSQVVTPSGPTDYVLTERSGGCSPQTITRTLHVDPVTCPVPVINSFAANPTQVLPGSPTQLGWSVSNLQAGAAVSILGPGLSQSVAASGAMQVTPPLTPGQYTYTLSASNPCSPGTVITAQVVVRVLACPQPSVLAFTAQPSSILSGTSGMIRLSWRTSDSSGLGETVSISPSVGAGLPANGFVDINAPALTTTYTITVSNGCGASTTAQVTVTVSPCPAPQIASFTATPNSVLQGAGGTIRLQWNSSDSSGSGLSVSIPGVSSGLPATGFIDIPAPSTSTTYTLNVVNGCGSQNQAQAPVTVSACPTPQITSFTADPSSVLQGAGGTVRLSWTAGDSSGTGLTVSIPGVADNLPATGFIDISAPSQTTTYTLIARNGCGAQSQAQATVAVSSCPAPQVAAFTAQPSSILVGSSGTVRLQWQVNDSSGLGATVTIQGIASGLPATGFIDVNAPQASTTYTLIAQNGCGAQASAQTTVTVTSCPAPVVNSFTANPPSVTPSTGSVRLSWNVSDSSGLGVTVSIAGIASGLPASGFVDIAPPQSNTTYTLTATNGCGAQAGAQTAVNVTGIDIDFGEQGPYYYYCEAETNHQWVYGGAGELQITRNGDYVTIVFYPTADGDGVGNFWWSSIGINGVPIRPVPNNGLVWQDISPTPNTSSIKIIQYTFYSPPGTPFQVNLQTETLDASCNAGGTHQLFFNYDVTNF